MLLFMITPMYYRRDKIVRGRYLTPGLRNLASDWSTDLMTSPSYDYPALPSNPISTAEANAL
jgi:hypothetical protein